MEVEQDKKMCIVCDAITGKYHLPGCRCMLYNTCMFDEFGSIKDAEDAGYKPCIECFPSEVIKKAAPIGNNDNKIYHLRGCSFEPKSIEKRKEFGSIKEAEDAGYRPCPVCCSAILKKAGIFVGSRSAQVFHLPGCDFEPISNDKRVEFKSIKEAENAGYRPCRHCCPDAYKELDMAIGSKNTLRYHLPGCEFEPFNPDIRVEFDSIEKAIEAGYSPCTDCFPNEFSKKEGLVIGSSNSHRFHKSGCKYEPFDTDKRVEFKTVLEAVKAGYQPCTNCCTDLPQRMVPVIGSSSSHMFHVRGCKFEPFSSQKRVEFESIKKAEADGYKPCSNCCTDVKNGKLVVIGSNNTYQFHLPGCDYEPISSEKRLEFRSVQAALKAGFKPCTNCRPAEIDEIDEIDENEDDMWLSEEIIDEE